MFKYVGYIWPLPSCRHLWIIITIYVNRNISTVHAVLLDGTQKGIHKYYCEPNHIDLPIENILHCLMKCCLNIISFDDMPKFLFPYNVIYGEWMIIFIPYLSPYMFREINTPWAWKWDIPSISYDYRSPKLDPGWVFHSSQGLYVWLHETNYQQNYHGKGAQCMLALLLVPCLRSILLISLVIWSCELFRIMCTDILDCTSQKTAVGYDKPGQHWGIQPNCARAICKKLFNIVYIKLEPLLYFFLVLD